jgi:pimeloyl-ACP methyl ester carboxylesterase
MHAAMDYMSREIKNFSLAEIDDAAHLPNMDQPNVFCRAVLNFLEALPDLR